jgi:hypothetical protein
MTWKIYDESVDLIEKRFQYFPQAFGWRGRRYRVEAVERCWTVSRRGWRRRVARHFFQVRCAEGTFEIYQEIKSNTWHLRRARLQQSRVPALGRAVPAWRRLG